MCDCSCVCVPDNLSEVLLRLMRGDSIRLQIPLINLVSSARLAHANEFPKRIAASVTGERKSSLCKANEAWVLKRTMNDLKMPFDGFADRQARLLFERDDEADSSQSETDFIQIVLSNFGVEHFGMR